MGSSTSICCSARSKKRRVRFFNHPGKERTNEFARAISHNNHYGNKLSIAHDHASISPTNPVLKPRNSHMRAIVLKDPAAFSVGVAAA